MVIGLLISYLCVMVYFTVVAFDVWFDGDLDEYPLSPKNIFEESEMNILGCMLVLIFLITFIPFYYIVIFLHWICHVGRRKK